MRALCADRFPPHCGRFTLPPSQTLRLERLPLDRPGETVVSQEAESPRERWRRWSEAAAASEESQLPAQARKLAPTQFARLLQATMRVATPLRLEETASVKMPAIGELPIRPEMKGQCLLVPSNPWGVCCKQVMQTS